MGYEELWYHEDPISELGVDVPDWIESTAGGEVRKVTAKHTPNALTRLREYIVAHGPIGAVRVSSAHASGAAKQYAYWGAVRYEIRLSPRGVVTAYAEHRASSDRRSERLAERDAQEIAEREDRIEYDGIGRLSVRDAEYVLAALEAR